MKKLTTILACVVVFFIMLMLPEKLLAQSPNKILGNELNDDINIQNYRTDGGVIILEDSILSSSQKQIIFVVTKDILQSSRVELQTVSSEGQVNKFQPLLFDSGLRRGQIIPILTGQLTAFNTTPWLRFSITITTETDIYYSIMSTPVGIAEQYKEPMITSISETGGYGTDYIITIKGIFDTTEPSLIVINTNIIIPSKAITQTPPGIIKVTLNGISRENFPAGKYLLTICQGGHCDTMTGRHR